jgi:integrase
MRPLSYGDIPDSVARARQQLAGNPELIARLERRGWERALIYKLASLTGLRRGEIEALTLRHLHLDVALPFLRMRRADTKNRQAADIPLRRDLAADLREWIESSAELASCEGRESSADEHRLDSPLFSVPKQLVKALNRDLRVAGIPKIDERGRSVDVHALRHSFGTLLSTSGVAPRTAQQAMRHSDISLTMQVYTDPALLDVAGAMERLPELPIGPNSEDAPQSATFEELEPARTVAKTVANSEDKTCQKESISDSLADDEDSLQIQKNPAKHLGFTGFSSVGATGFEPATSTSRT